jgi:adenylate kinase family enzyme
MNITSGLKSPLIEANRILVIGCPGSGKSTLAKRLSRARTTLTTSPWTATSTGNRAGERDRATRSTAGSPRRAEQRWIMDGTGLSSFHLRLPRADAVIWLRLPRYACLYGAVSRTFRYFGRNRPELPAGCPERLSLDALAYIWNFERDAAPLIEVALQDYGLANSTVNIRSRKAANRFAALSA